MDKRIIIYIILVVVIFLTGCKDNVGLSNSNTERDIIIQQLETKHFKFYSKDEDIGCLKDLSNALEENYIRITTDLKTSLNKKADIYIYSDLSTYHKAINQPNAQNWEIASTTYDSNVIKMVNPLNADGFSYSDFMKTIVHEFVHIVEHNISGGKYVPRWLDEGIAAYESGLDDGVYQFISNAKYDNKIPSLKDLDTDAGTFGNIGGYQFSYSIVEYAVNNYGYDKLTALIKAPSDFEKIFGFSIEDFEEEWIAQLK